MRTSTPRIAALAAATLLLAACGEDEATDTDAPEAEEAADAEAGDDEDEDEDADEGDDSGDESEGDGSAWAVWDGEEYATTLHHRRRSRTCDSRRPRWCRRYDLR